MGVNNPYYRGTWQEFWELIAYAQNNLGMSSNDFNILTFLQKLDQVRNQPGTSLGFKAKIERILGVFCWDYTTQSVPDYVMEWINDFDDLSARQDAFCQLLVDVVNRNDPNDFAFAEWVTEQYFRDPTNRFFGMTAQEIIQRIFVITGKILFHPIKGDLGFPLWDFVADYHWRPS